MSSSQLPDIGGGGIPGSTGPSGGKPGDDADSGGEGENADQAGGSGAASGVPTWDDRGQGDGSGNEWEKSNQVPEVPVDITAKGEGAGSKTDGVPGKGGAADDLEDALEDFDGGIMAERSAIRDRAAQTPNAGGGKAAGSGGIPRDAGAAGEGEGRVVGTGGGVGSLPDGPGTISKAPGAPMRSAGIPKDIDDARDDDVIARQLREAAMAEADPAIREKLWADYQKYKRR
jgi:hypothetical protein